MHRFRRLSCLTLALVLLLSLAACGGGSASAGTASTTAAAETGAADMTYTAVFSDLPEDVADVYNAAWYDGRFYTLQQIYREETGKVQNLIVSFLPDGSDVQSVTLSLKEDELSRFYPLSDGGGWLTAATYSSDEDGMLDYSTRSLYLIRVDAGGQEVQRVDLSFASEEGFYAYIDSLITDADGHVLFTCNERLYVLDADGNRLFDLDCGWSAALAMTAQGVPAISGTDSSGACAVREIDISAKGFGQSYSVSGDYISGIFAGDGTYPLYAVYSDRLYGLSSDAEPAEILAFLDLDIMADNLGSIAHTGEGRFAAFVSDDTGNFLCTMAESPAGVSKTTLTLACLNADYSLKEQVIAFNRSSTEYHIDLVDYAEYNTDGDTSAGLQKLSTEITAGQIPDILALSGLPYQTYAGKGLLEDLGARLDQDPELSREDFLPGALTALETNGGLYALADSMQAQCLLTLRSTVGERSVLTPEDLRELLAAHPGTALSPDSTSSGVLELLCLFSLDDFIDTESGTCSFDSDAFRDLLEVSALSPAEIDFENYDYTEPIRQLTDGSVLFTTMNLYDISELQYAYAVLGDEFAAVGYPTGSGTGIVAYFELMLGISASSPNADAAWDFVRSFFVDADSGDESGFTYHGCIPTLKTRFEAQIREAMTPSTYTDENGETVEYPKVSMSYADGPTVEIYAATDEEVALYRSIIDSVDRSYSYDETLMDIIMEEAGAFFSGQKTAAEVSSVIQNRVQIYIAETRG